jgi:hypothetical protein
MKKQMRVLKLRVDSTVLEALHARGQNIDQIADEAFGQYLAGTAQALDQLRALFNDEGELHEQFQDQCSVALEAADKARPVTPS